MSEHRQIQSEDRTYELHVALHCFNDDLESGDEPRGAVEYMWGRDGSETLDPSQAIKVTLIDGEEYVLQRDDWLAVEYSQNSLWQGAVQTEDKNGRPYARLDALSVGDSVETDDCFTCRKVGQVSKVKIDEGRLFIDCADGKHFLDGQLQDEGDALIGVYPV